MDELDRADGVAHCPDEGVDIYFRGLADGAVGVAEPVREWHVIGFHPVVIAGGHDQLQALTSPVAAVVLGGVEVDEQLLHFGEELVVLDRVRGRLHLAVFGVRRLHLVLAIGFCCPAVFDLTLTD